MKRAIVYTLVFTMLSVLAACNGRNDAGTASPTPSAAATMTPVPEITTMPDIDDGIVGDEDGIIGDDDTGNEPPASGGETGGTNGGGANGGGTNASPSPSASAKP